MDRKPRKLWAAARGRPLVAASVGTALLSLVVVGALALAGGSSDGPTHGQPEVKLDESTPAGGSTRAKEPPRRGRGPTVVELQTPGGAKTSQRDQGTRGDEAPKHVLKENARIRQELGHLKALAAERGRVSLALSNAGASFDGPLRLGAGGLAWPVSGTVVSPFGQRWGRLHAGIDIASPAGVVVRAAEAGRVAISGPTGGYGNYVCVQHTARLTSCYAHLSRFLTEKGANVDQGEAVGLVGCTGHCFGDHLHFETWVGGRPVDPMPYL